MRFGSLPWSHTLIYSACLFTHGSYCIHMSGALGQKQIPGLENAAQRPSLLILPKETSAESNSAACQGRYGLVVAEFTGRRLGWVPFGALEKTQVRKSCGKHPGYDLGRQCQSQVLQVE